MIHYSGEKEIPEAHERADGKEALDARRPGSRGGDPLFESADEQIEIRAYPESEKKKEKLNVASDVRAVCLEETLVDHPLNISAVLQPDDPDRLSRSFG